MGLVIGPTWVGRGTRTSHSNFSNSAKWFSCVGIGMFGRGVKSGRDIESINTDTNTCSIFSIKDFIAGDSERVGWCGRGNTRGGGNRG